MRAFVRHSVAAVAAIGLLATVSPLAGAALAQDGFATYSSRDGRLSLRYPASWQKNELQTSDDSVRVFVGSGDYECQVWAIPKTGSRNASADAVRRAYATPLSAQQWTNIVEPLEIFRGGVTVGASSVDTSGAWPVQHVMLNSPQHQVRGTLQGRPGVELMSLCLSYDATDRSAVFAQIEASIDSNAPAGLPTNPPLPTP